MSASVLREEPTGHVLACPECGQRALLQCWHDYTGTVLTVAMRPTEAARLRREFGEPDRLTLTCVGCGFEGVPEEGSTLGNGWRCAACNAGRLNP